MAKKIFFLLIVFIHFSLLIAQELEFEIEQEEQNTDSQTPFFKFFNENISGSILVFEAFGVYGSRSNYSLQLQYNKEFSDWGKLVLTANGYYNKVVLKLKLQDEYKNDRETYPEADYPLELELEEKTSGGEFREAYFDLNLGNFMSLSVGNKLIAFGQFDLFSPIDFLSLPSRFGSNEIGFSKLSNRLSQQTFQFGLYPISGTEIQAYYFPKIAVDPFIEDSLNQVSRETYDKCKEGLTCRQKDPSARNGVDEQIDNADVTNIPLDNEDQYAGRVLFYPNWGTFGFTSHQGYGNFGIIEPTRILTLENNTTTNATDDYISVNKEYLRRTIYGLELSIPVGGWSWNLEIAYNTAVTNQFDLDTLDLYPLEGEEKYLAREELADFLKWVREENNNQLNYENQQIFAAFGVDANFSLWKLNLVIFYFQNIYSSELQKGVDLYNTWESVASPGNNRIDSALAPTFNIVRYWNENKETLLGLIAGIIPGGSGASFYFTQEYFESLSILASIEAVIYNGDSQLVNNSDFRYEPLEETSFGMRLGLGYKF